MRAAILARVSTEAQAGERRASLTNQEELLRQVAARHGWEVVRVFAIPGESAFSGDMASRPQFREAIEAGKRGEFEILLVSEFSRFSRNKRLTENVLDELRRHRIALFGANGVNYTANDDMATMDSWAAYRASADHSVRVRRGHEAKFRRGLHVGDVPFGYRRPLTPDGRGGITPDASMPVEIVEDEAEAVRWAFNAYARRVSMTDIAREFNRRGLRPRSKRGNVLFEASSIQSILENEFYAGVVSLNVEQTDELGRRERVRETREGLHVPILTQDEWLAVVVRRSRQTHAGQRETLLLTGLARCSSCGAYLHAHSMSGRAPLYRDRPREASPCGARVRSITNTHVDVPVQRIIGELSADREFIAAVNRASSPGVRRTEAVAERRRMDEERKRIAHAYRIGLMREEEVEVAMSELRRREMDLGPDLESVSSALASMQSWAEEWWAMDLREQRGVVGTVLRDVVVDLDRKEIAVAAAAEYEDLFEQRACWAAGVRWYTPDRNRTARSAQLLWTPAELGVAV